MENIKQSIEIDEILIPSPCVSNKIGIIYRIITGAYNRAMKPYGISTVQRSILMFTKYRGPANQKTVSRVLAMEKSTCSRDIKALVGKGLLILDDGKDARNRILRLSKNGENLLQLTQPIWENIHAKTNALLGKTSIDELDRIIIALKKNKEIYQ